jgi:hypothetical protein
LTLIGVLTIGFVIPNAFGQITQDVAQMFEQVLNLAWSVKTDTEGVKGKTDNLSQDPASSTDIRMPNMLQKLQ